MRIILTSDLHGNLPEIPECDLLIIAGDICPDFMYYAKKREDYQNGAREQARWLNTEFRDWLAAVPAAHVVGIAGNHDFVFEEPDKHPVWPDLPWHYLQDSEITIGGLRIYGIPWVPNLASWAFFGGYGGVESMYLDKIPEGIDILVSHGPPQDYGDQIGGDGKYGLAEPTHVGCENAGAMLERVKPRVFVCGHIHEGFGWYRHPDIEEGIYNVAFVDANYDPRGLVEEIHLEPVTA